MSDDFNLASKYTAKKINENKSAPIKTHNVTSTITKNNTDIIDETSQLQNSPPSSSNISSFAIGILNK